MIAMLRIIFFLISTLGYVFATRHWLKINSFSSYIFVFCSIAITVLFCGMINILEISAYTIFGVGLILFAYFIVKRKTVNIFTLKSFSLINIAFIFGTSVICVILLNTNFIHYDNFSHWGIVVKYMLSTDAFPDITTTLVEFADYPLGASSFIYYVCKIVGNTQGTMLFGQSLLIFTCFYSTFSIIEEKKRFLLFAALALGLCTTSFFNIAIRMNNLLVDFLLPILAVSALSVIYSNRNNFAKACVIVTPILGLLSVVKNTGIFFVSTCLCYLIFVAVGQPSGLNRNVKLILTCCSTTLFSVLPMLIWKLYFDVNFEGLKTKFEINQNNISQVTSSKTAEQINEIIQTFFSTVLNLKDPATITFLAVNIVGLAAYFATKYGIKKKWHLLKVVILTDIMVVLYYTGLLGLYVFLMPIDEAIRLAGFERYICSIIIYQLGCIALCTTVDIERSFHIKIGEHYDIRGFKSISTKNLYQKTTLCCILLSILILTSEVNGLNYMKDEYSSSLPAKVQALVGENKDSPNQDRYLIYASNKDEQISSYYLQYIFRYMLFTPNVDAVYDITSSEFLTKAQDYDGYIIFESDKAFENSVGDELSLLPSTLP